MGIFVFVVIAIIVLIVAVSLFMKEQDRSENKRGEELDETAASLDGFTPTATVNGYSNYYKFMVDETNKSICYISGKVKMIIPFSKILGVSLIENGTTVSSKSTTRTIGGGLIGGALAGTAGAIVGGLSGNSKQKNMVSSVQVKIIIKDIKNPNLTFDAFSAKMVSNFLNEIDTTDAFYGKIYKQCLAQANRIVDMVSVIIDEVDKHETPAHTELSIADELKKLADLKKEGILTENEFQAQKKALLKPVEEEQPVISEGGISNEVRELVSAGKKMQAVSAYIKETGANLSDAIKVIESYI